MAKAVQRRRGSSVEHASFTGVLAEITVDLTKKSLVVHDGTTVGGFTLAREDLTNTKTTSLTALTGTETASNDTFLIYDVSTNVMKSITRAELNNAMTIDDLENVKIVSGAINGTAIGATTASTGRFTSLIATGNTIIDGNLTVNGTTTTISTTELTVEDKNITVAFGAANAAVADGAGLTVAGANALITYVSSGDKWSLNKPLDLGANNLTTTGTTSLNNLSYTGTLTGGTGVVNIGSGQIYKDASGNVGIGIESTQGKLHTIGDVISQTSLNNSGAFFFQSRKSRGTAAAPTTVVNGDDVGGLLFLGYNGSAWATGAGILGDVEGAVTSAVPMSMKFFAGGPVQGGFERMRISANGNVSIGTSAPTSLLHVEGDITIADKIIHSGDTDTSIRFPLADTVIVETAGVERLRVDSIGNVGIGISTPIAPLTIQRLGVLGTVEGSNALSFNIIAEHASGGVNFFDYTYYGSSGGSSAMIRLKKARGSVATPSIVGVNEVTTRISGMGYDGEKFIDNALIRFNIDSAPALNDMPGRIEFYTTPVGTGIVSLKMVLKENGNLGIGISAPTEKLDVVGNIKSSGTVTATNFIGALTPRISTITSTATITPNSAISDQYNVTALATTATFAIPSGTPTDGQKLSIRIKAVTTSRTISWVTTAGGYRVIGTILPLTAPVGKTIYVGCIYNAADSFWDVVAVATEE